MTHTDITPEKLIVNCVTREQYEQAKVENRINPDEVWVVEPSNQIDGMNKTIVNVKTPVNETDASNRKYVDDSINTLKQSIESGYQKKGDYLNSDTTLSDLQNTPGFQTLSQVQKLIEDAPYQPKGDYVLKSDTDFVSRNDVDEIVNDSKVRRLWNASYRQYLDSDGNIYNVDASGKETYSDRFVRDSERSSITEIISQDGNRKIDGDGNVLTRTGTSGHWTDWTYSDGLDHTPSMVIYHNDTYGWYIGIEQDTYESIFYETEEECQNVLANSDHIDWYSMSDYEKTNVVLTSSRTWIETDNWQKVDELALKSDIQQSQITEADVNRIVESKGYQTESQVNSIISSKGYQTQSDVNSIINGKGFVTQSQVENQITAKGYQTQAQVQAIAASTLPTGYAETELIGTLEDGVTQVSFKILTKGI